LEEDEMYFVIQTNEDGEVSVDCFEDAEELMHEYEWDDLDAIKDEYHPQFFVEAPDSDPMYWGRRCLIIKGDIIVPKEKQVVTKLEIE
jgi:hypothetical protein